MAETINTVAPQAYVVLFNYVDRMASIDGKATKDSVKLTQTFINTTSLIAVNTTKPKGTPAGTFEIVLAPTRNWLAKITPGSWLAIVMTRDTSIDSLSIQNVGTADEDKLKMFGRIDTVNVDVSVNSETGARSTRYVVRGRDWGSVFDTNLYVDPLYLTLFKKENATTAQTVILGNNSSAYRGTTELVKNIISFWGQPLEAIRTENQELTSNVQFVLPTSAAQYMFGNGNNRTFSELIKVVAGQLSGYDKYKDVLDSGGLIDINSLFGNHTFWQVLNDNCNNTLNELVSDIRWVNGKPQMALYKRIRPFGNRKSMPADSDGVKHLYSLFRNIKTTTIPLTDVLAVNAATDFSDRINFIEVVPKYHGMSKAGAITLDNKKKARVVDTQAYAREGFKPMFASPNFYNINSVFSKKEDIDATTDWKFLLREWYFNTHTLLKGTFSFIGQNQYIAVGENIQVNAVAIGNTPMVSEANRASPTFLTAHVEGISHSFSVDQETGVRRFITTVSFVRGLITDENRVPVGNTYSALDQKANSDGRFNTGAVSSSSEYDPDVQKKKGN